ERVKLRQLILSERLGRKKIQGPRGGILEDRIQDGGVIAKRLARRRRRNGDDIAAAEDVPEGFRLVRVELFDSPRPQGGNQPVVGPLRVWREGCRHRGKP